MIVLLPSVLSTIKMFGRLFSFALGICTYRQRRALDGASFKNKIKMLSFSQAEIYAKRKKLSKHAKNQHYHVGCSFRVWEEPSEQVNRNLFTPFLQSFSRRIFSTKNQEVIILLSRDICKTKEPSKHAKQQRFHVDCSF